MQFYLDRDLCRRFNVSYTGQSSVSVPLRDIRTAREWDSKHSEMWQNHASHYVTGVRSASDNPGWFWLVSK